MFVFSITFGYFRNAIYSGPVVPKKQCFQRSTFRATFIVARNVLRLTEKLFSLISPARTTAPSLFFVVRNDGRFRSVIRTALRSYLHSFFLYFLLFLIVSFPYFFSLHVWGYMYPFPYFFVSRSTRSCSDSFSSITYHCLHGRYRRHTANHAAGIVKGDPLALFMKIKKTGRKLEILFHMQYAETIENVISTVRQNPCVISAI